MQKKYERAVTQCDLKTVLFKIKELVSPVMYKFISSQLRMAKISPYARRWSVEEKNFFLQVFLAGPRAYKVLTSQMKIPTEKTIKKCVSGIEINPGFSLPILNAIKIVAAKMKPEDRLCNLLLDEIKIRPGFSYYAKSDQVIGYENYGDLVESSSKAATHALVFMVRGVCIKWKQVFATFFSADTTPSAALKILVIAGLEKLVAAGLEPVSVICDMGTNNQKLFFSELEVTVEKPFFLMPNTSRKVFCIFDPPHLLKCLRNNFAKYKVTFNEAKTASWEDIRDLYEFDKEQTHRIAKKLTDRHVNLQNLDKMSVRRAAETLSGTVAACLCTLSVFRPDEKRVSRANTADFSAAVNDLFDSVNSRCIKHKTNRLLSTVTQTSIHMNKWEELSRFVKSIKFETGEKKINFPCLQGWQITLSAFQQMVPELLSQMSFILMNRFNQDALESFFSKVNAIFQSFYNSFNFKLIALYATCQMLIEP